MSTRPYDVELSLEHRAGFVDEFRTTRSQRSGAIRLRRRTLMKITEVYKLRTGSPIWVWVVHCAKGRWWPGVVEAIQINDRPRIVVSFECRAVRAQRYCPAVRAGIVTTAMRYLEPRDPSVESVDQPHFTPVSLLRRPEERELLTSDSSILSPQRRSEAQDKNQAIVTNLGI